MYRTLLILDTYTDSIKKTRIEIAALLKKYGCVIAYVTVLSYMWTICLFRRKIFAYRENPLQSSLNPKLYGIVLNLFHHTCVYSGKLGESGSSSYAYHFKGLIYVPVNPERPLTPDQATELAIEAGAEEVDEDVDDNGVKVFRVRPLSLY